VHHDLSYVLITEHDADIFSSLRCVIPVVCVTNEREENVVKQHN